MCSKIIITLKFSGHFVSNKFRIKKLWIDLPQNVPNTVPCRKKHFWTIYYSEKIRSNLAQYFLDFVQCNLFSAKSSNFQKFLSFNGFEQTWRTTTVLYRQLYFGLLHFVPHTLLHKWFSADFHELFFLQGMTKRNLRIYLWVKVWKM